MIDNVSNCLSYLYSHLEEKVAGWLYTKFYVGIDDVCR